MHDSWPCFSVRGWWMASRVDWDRPCPAWLNRLGHWVAKRWNPIVCRFRGHELTPQFKGRWPGDPGDGRLLVTESRCCHCGVTVEHSEPEAWLSTPDHPLGIGMVYALRKERP